MPKLALPAGDPHRLLLNREGEQAPQCILKESDDDHDSGDCLQFPMDALQVYTLVEGFCQHSDRRCQHAGHGWFIFTPQQSVNHGKQTHRFARFEYFFYLDSLFLADSDALLLLLLLLLLLGLLLLLLLLGPLRESVGHVALQLRRISLP